MNARPVLTVDAWVVLGNCAEDLRSRGLADAAEQVDALEAAISELIAAGRALQDAMDEHETSRLDAGPSRRFVEADARHRAALAAVDTQYREALARKQGEQP